MRLQTVTVVHVLWALLGLFVVVVPGVFSVSDDPVQLSDNFGGLDGHKFSDQISVVAGQTIGSLTIYADRHVNGIRLEVIDPTTTSFIHGASRGKEKVLKLGAHEYVTSMEAHWGEIADRTLIFYLRFKTNAGNAVSGGSMTENKETVKAPEGFQLGGFFGLDSDVIDNLGAIWTRISTRVSAKVLPAAVDPAVLRPESSGVLGSRRPAAESFEKSIVVAATESVDTSSSGSFGVPVQKSLVKKTLARKASVTESSTEPTAPFANEPLLWGPGIASPEDSTAAIDAISGSTHSTPTSTDGSGETPATKDPAAESSTEHTAHFSVDGSGIAPLLDGPDIASPEDSIAGIDATAADGSASGSGAASPEAVAAHTAPTGAPTTPTGAPTTPTGAPTAPTGAPTEAPTSAPPTAPPKGTEAPAGPTMTVKDSVVLSECYGGPGGNDFSDKNLVNSGQTVKSISIYAGKRLDGITLEISAPKTLTFTHGGTGGDRKELLLGEGERITSMDVNWGNRNGHSRIFYVNFLTNKGNSLSGGSMTGEKATVVAPAGFQLAGFFGKSAKEIDSLGAVWAYIDLVTPAPTPAPPSVIQEDLPGTTAPADIAGSLSEVTTKVNKNPVQLSDSFGGPHGVQFSDRLAITSGMTIASVTIRAGRRVDGVTVQVSAPKEMTFTHGKSGGNENILTLEPGEYITTMEAHWDKKSEKTRIFYLSLGTNKGKTVTGGTQTDLKGSVTAPMGYQLAGFFGRDGDEIDHLGAVWSSIAAVNETVFTSISADDDIVLSELYGGPHGNAFSDINKIKFGQNISSVTIRAEKRVDAITLQITAPELVTMNHGGHGGKEQTLTLEPNEVITSVEIHWSKKDDHTRVFYICFTTSAGKTLAGGTKTDNKSTLKPPEGFVLSGFYGRAAGEVDQLGVIWTRKTAKNILLTDPSGVGNGTYGTTIRNWVGPTIGKTTDTGCYRKTAAFDSTNMCPLGYSKDDFDCIVQCPMAYPVECSMECIPQNDDCALAVLTKIGSVAAVVLHAATAGVFSEIYKVYKTTKWVVMCVKSIVEVVRGLIYYFRYRQTTAPQGDTAELLAAAYQTELVMFDLPIAVCTCLGMPISKHVKFGKDVLTVVEAIVKQAITNGDEIISTGANVLNLLSGNGMVNKSRITVGELDDLVASNSSCGYELKRLTDRVTRAVLKHRSTGASVNDTRVKVYESLIVRNDIPIITNNCMGELLASKTMTTAYETRDLLRKTFGVIVDQLIDTGTTDNGKDVAKKDYMLEVANMGLLALSIVDPTGIAYMASQFVQPLCGPTAYVGEIDDGTLNDALGLTTMDEAFIGSYGSYRHAGDGVIHLIFESVDTKDVTVVIHSGGDDYAEVDVGAGDITTWDATFPELEDKTMYLDRWRPGIMNLPGSGGGSLLLWIPRSSEGGHITMHVRINPS